MTDSQSCNGAREAPQPFYTTRLMSYSTRTAHGYFAKTYHYSAAEERRRPGGALKRLDTGYSIASDAPKPYFLTRPLLPDVFDSDIAFE